MEKELEELTNEIILIFHHLDLFKKLSEVIDKNQKVRETGGILLEWMRNSFIVDLVISIGRICDTDSRTDSLFQFLRELREKDEFLTRERYLKLYNNDIMIDIANKHFDGLAGEGKQNYSVDKINADIEMFTQAYPCKKIIDFRNQCIAHNDKNKTVDRPTYGDLLDAFNVIEEIVKKYNSLLLAKSMINLTPTIQNNWIEVLTIPWYNNTNLKI